MKFVSCTNVPILMTEWVCGFLAPPFGLLKYSQMILVQLMIRVVCTHFPLAGSSFGHFGHCTDCYRFVYYTVLTCVINSGIVQRARQSRSEQCVCLGLMQCLYHPDSLALLQVLLDNAARYYSNWGSLPNSS